MKNKIIPFILIILLAPGLRAGSGQDGTPAADEAGAKPKAGRAFLEMGLNLAVSTINYWHKYSKFIEDWQFTLTWKDQKRKFFTSEGLRFDSNNLRLNWTHAWSGALYYNWARSNRYGPFASFLFSTGGSFFWEYFSEWREIASINDMIYTAFGGPAIGEPLYQIADHFRRRRGLASRLAEALVNPPLAINDLLDGRERPPRVPLQDRSDFRFSLGGKQGPASLADGASSHAAIDIDLRLVTLPGYGRPGSGSGYSRLPLDNEYRIAFSFNGRGVEEFSASTRCLLSGWWRRSVRQGADGGLHGSEFWFGPVMAWDFFQKKPVADYDGDELGMTDPWFEREQPTRYTDKFSTLHLIGPAVDWTGYAGRLSARFGAEATLDFAMINSLPYNAYSADHDVWGVKTTLHNWGYYYSLGYTLAGRLDLRRGPFRAEAGVRYQRFASIQGLDRFQKDIRDDSPLRDSRFTWNAALALAIPRSPLFLSLNLEGIDRWGRFHEVSATNRETRFFYRLGASF
ncbi:MAG: DUF3943 domain-containing protein [Acidobacteria bacterium]|nr:DUF3943 domain-containing protein [Acidobacteriota bacterium]